MILVDFASLFYYISFFIKVFINHLSKLFDYENIIGRNREERKKAEGKGWRRSWARNQVPIGSVVIVSGFQLIFWHQKHAQMEPMVSLAKKVEAARKKPLRKIHAKTKSTTNSYKVA